MKRPKEKAKVKKMAGKNIALLIIVIAIAVIPLVFLNKAEFSGSDDQAKAVITKINKDYKPWFKPLWTPPSGEMESLLFALQAGIGSFVIGYYIGFARGRKKPEEAE